jgi:hypothetical protein
MKKTYAAARLLEHGPLQMGELIAITRWDRKVCEWVMRELVSLGIVVSEKHGPKRATYRLAHE